MVGGESFELSASGVSTRRSYRLSYPLLDDGVRIELTYLVLQTSTKTTRFPANETRGVSRALYSRKSTGGNSLSVHGLRSSTG